ncbi:MAG: GNAT superfamily N-acetyltransferase [Gammaproteobacteria bacterium]|jgi:GNAT superfamily N-acetyltransferase
MSANHYSVRRVRIDERIEWEELWLAYLTFYKTELAGSLTDLLWHRIHDCQHEIRCLVIEDNNTSRLTGLTHYYPHSSTWCAEPVVYLNDLFVHPDCRGQGLGKTLIEKVVEDSRLNGWSEVYWHTEVSNSTARKLYDKITGGDDGFVSYRIPVSGPDKK